MISEFVAVIIAERKDITESEELILNCVAAVNNLTYYTTKQSTLTPQHLTIAQCKHPVLCRLSLFRI